MDKVKFTTKSMAQLAMFMAVTIVLGYVNKLIPEMPQGGTISIDIIAIFICAYTMGAGYGVVCGIGVSVLQFILGQAVYYGPWSVLLDYVLPLAVIGIAACFKNIKIGRYELYTGIIVAMILKFLCHFCSGAFLFGMYAPEVMNPLVYSFLYNIWYNIATMIVCLIFVPVLHKRFKSVIK